MSVWPVVLGFVAAVVLFGLYLAWQFYDEHRRERR